MKIFVTPKQISVPPHLQIARQTPLKFICWFQTPKTGSVAVDLVPNFATVAPQSRD